MASLTLECLAIKTWLHFNSITNEKLVFEAWDHFKVSYYSLKIKFWEKINKLTIRALIWIKMKITEFRCLTQNS